MIKNKRLLAAILAGALLLTILAIGIGGALASKPDITATMDRANTYPVVEVGSFEDRAITGARYCSSADTNIATAHMQSTFTVRITGVSAGVTTIAVGSTAGLVRAMSYQITNSSRMASYILKAGGEVYFSGPGKTKNTPLVATPASAQSTIAWRTLNSNVATVNAVSGAIASVGKGACNIVGSFTDKWGIAREVYVLVAVGVSLDGSDLGVLADLIKQGEDILAKDPNPYKAEGLQKLANAVNQGKAILDKESPTASEIQKGIDDLRGALDGLELKGGGNIIKGPDGNWYRPLVKPKNVYEVVLDENGTPKQPPEYVYNPDGNPGNGKNRPAYPGSGGTFWVEDPPGSNIYKMVDDNTGLLIDSPAIWGGPDRQFGTADDKPVVKFGSDYWVDMGQNVFRKILGPTSIGPLTGGGPGENPAIDPVFEIFDHTAKDGRYYVGPVGQESDGTAFYYGDKANGNGDGKLNSRFNYLHPTDQKFYLDANGNMVTTNPNTIASVSISPASVSAPKGSTTNFTATVLRADGSANSDGVAWSVSPAGPGTSISSAGVLTIGTGETATNLTVTATSNKDTSKSGTATVTVTTDPGGVKEVLVSPSSATVAKGTSKSFTAIVIKNNGGEDLGGVTWSVNSTASSISQSGLLTVGTGETAAVLIVTATSKTAPSVFGTATVVAIDNPIVEVPTVVEGRELNTAMTGDSANWIEVARNGNYSLIVRCASIKGITCFNKAVSNIKYADSMLRDHINTWFDDNLPSNARIRGYTVRNTAKDTIGTIGGTLDGFSKPTADKRPFGIDTAFAMSYGEAAKFCSMRHAENTTTYLNSSPAAQNNFKRIDCGEVWLRTPGRSNVGAADLSVGVIRWNGDLGAYRIQWWDDRGPHWVFYWYQALPALWVDQAIFD